MSIDNTPYRSGGTAAAATDEPMFAVSDLVALLRRRAWLLIAIIVPMTIGAAVLASMIPNRYTAFATVMVESTEKTVTNVGRVVDGIRVDTPAIESAVEVIASNGVALRVIDELGLRHDPEFGGIPASLDVNGAATALPAGAKDYVLAIFLDGLEARRVRNSHVIEINYTASSAVKAARIANAIAKTYIANELDQKIRQSGIATDFLKTKLESLRSKVAKAEHAVERFKAENSLFDADGRPLSEKHLTRLMEQTVSARNATAEAKSRYDQLSAMMREGKPKGAIADVLKSHTVRMLKDQQARVAGRVAELAIKYGPRHPSMQKARAELRDIERQLNREVDQILFNLRNEYEVAVAHEKTLAKNLVALEKEQGKMGQISVKLKELERDANTSRLLYEAILSRYKQTAETQSMQLPDSRVVETASVPLRPSSPKRVRIVLLAFAGSTVMALGMALLVELYQTGSLVGKHAPRAANLQQIAALPRMALAGSAEDRIGTIRKVLAEPRGDYVQGLDGITYALDEASAVDNADEDGMVVLLASTLPGEGRTTVASNLAHLYAQRGIRTLLIDGDLRKGALTGLLAPNPHAGLHDCLAAGVPAHIAILRDGSTGLHFLPARGAQPMQLSPSAALSSDQAQQTMAQLKKSFDKIIVDVPPLLPVVDGRIMARYADKIVLVMSWHKTPKELAMRAVATLGNDAGKVIGVAANGVAYASSDRLPPPLPAQPVSAVPAPPPASYTRAA